MNVAVAWRAAGLADPVLRRSEKARSRMLLCKHDRTLLDNFAVEQLVPLALETIEDAIANFMPDCSGHRFKRCRTRPKFQIDH